MSKPDTAMVLAAGFGTRMMPLTATRPKPLIPVNGKPLIDYTLDILTDAGIDTAIVNVHYLADQIEAHLRQRNKPKVIVSDERGEVLETGGGLIKASVHFPDSAIFCANTDAILVYDKMNPCISLCDAWEDDRMDALLLLCPVHNSTGYFGSGDFYLGAGNRLSWEQNSPDDQRLIYTGLQIIHPRLFATTPLEKISTRIFWDKAMTEKRLFGLCHEGLWMHVGDPSGLAEAENYYLTNGTSA